MRGRAWAYAALFAAAAVVAAVVLSWTGGNGGGGGGPPADVDAGDGAVAARLREKVADLSRDIARLEAHDVPRIASGSIRLRLVDGDTRLPVPAASIAVEGLAASGKPVRSSGVTDPEGNALVLGVAVGEGFAVRVSPPAGKVLERREVAVSEDGTTDLGTLYTAAHGVIEGLVVDEKGAPLPKVQVALTMDPSTLAASDADPFPHPAAFSTPIDSASTDDAGVFRFATLPLGLAALRADLEGYRTAIDRALVEKKPEPTRVRMVLARGVVLRGRVEDGDEKGIARAVVEVGTTQRGLFAPRVSIETDDEGGFEIPGFAEGPRFGAAVRVTALHRTPVFFPRLRSVEGFLRIVLRGGALLEITVVDEWRETPVADALVTEPRPYDPREGGELGRYETTTDGRGRAILDLPPGASVRPWIAAKGYVGGGIGEEHGDAKAFKLRYKGDIITSMVAGETRPLLLWIRRGPIVMGVVRDPLGAPLPRARVRAEYFGEKHSATVTTDGAGEYRLTDVDVPLRPDVVARSEDGRATARDRIPAVHAEEVAIVRVDLRLVPVAPPVEPPAAEAAKAGHPPPRQPRASVRGRVVDRSGSPLPDALVTGGLRKVRTDVSGEFLVTEVPLVEDRSVGGLWVSLSFTSDGYFRSGIRLRGADGDTLDARDVVLGFGQSIRGIVKRSNGDAVPFPGVRLPGHEDVGGAARTVVGREDGTFEFRGLSPGSYAVEALGPGYVSARPARVDLNRPDAAVKVEIVVIPQIVVEGRVEDETGAAIAQASVSFEAHSEQERDGPEDRWTTTTDLSGRFRLETIAANVTTILATAMRRSPARVPVPPTGTFLRIVLRRS